MSNVKNRYNRIIICAALCIIIVHMVRQKKVTNFLLCASLFLTIAFSALMLLVGQHGIQPVKKLSGGVLAWLSVCSEVQTCI